MTTLRGLCVAIAFIMVAMPSYRDAHAFETGDAFVTYEWPTRFMRRYEQMGENEHITYPAHVYGTSLTDAQAENILEHLSVMTSTITASMYGTNGFSVRSVTFTLESNGVGQVTTGDPVPFNVNAGGTWFGMGYKANTLNFPPSWALNPDYVNHPLWHELAHYFQARHLDGDAANDGDGQWTRSNMNSGSPNDVPPDYIRLGGDDMAAAMHMYRYATDVDAPQCPEFYTFQAEGVCPRLVPGCDYPNVAPYPEGTWRCDPDLLDHLGIQLRNQGEETCMTVADGENGTPISAAVCDYATPAQTWDMLADDDGSYRLMNHETGKCMQVRDGSRSPDTIIEQADCNDADSGDATQKFYPFADGSGHYSLRLELSGLFLDARGGVIQQIADGDPSQRWSLSSCGNDEVETAEQCEQDSDCDVGASCLACLCEGETGPEPIDPGGEPVDPIDPGEDLTDPGAEPTDPRVGMGGDAEPNQDSGSTSADQGGCSCRSAGAPSRPGHGYLVFLLPWYWGWRLHRRGQAA